MICVNTEISEQGQNETYKHRSSLSAVTVSRQTDFPKALILCSAQPHSTNTVRIAQIFLELPLAVCQKPWHENNITIDALRAWGHSPKTPARRRSDRLRGRHYENFPTFMANIEELGHVAWAYSGNT